MENIWKRANKLLNTPGKKGAAEELLKEVSLCPVVVKINH
jgi:hypothetical protein